ncbi:MAG: terminase family protein [Nanoarchaeota archaeon]|nr:terminase family protein [Nanoarchaeota archaeon]
MHTPINIPDTLDISQLSNFPIDMKIAILKRLKEDKSYFIRNILGMELFPYQVDLVDDLSRKICIVKGRQVGMSMALAALTIAEAVTSKCTIAIISPSLRQSSLLFKYIKDFFFTNEVISYELTNKNSRFTQTTIELSNGSIIYSLPAGNDGRTIRGISLGKGSLLIYDEAAFIPDKVYDATDYFTATGGREILSSTPLGKQGHFYDMYTANTYTIHHIPSKENPLISNEWIEEKRLEKSNTSFLQEIMGEFTDGEGLFFPYDIVQTCIDANISMNLTKGERYVAGIDLGIERDPSVLTIGTYEDGELVVKFIKSYIKQSGNRDREHTTVTGYQDIINDILTINDVYGIDYIAVDATNQSYVSETLAKSMTVYPIKFNSSTTTGNPMKTSLMENLLGSFASHILTIPNHNSLLRQLHNYSFNITPRATYKFKEKDEDFIDSLALFAWIPLKGDPDSFAVI